MRKREIESEMREIYTKREWQRNRQRERVRERQAREKTSRERVSEKERERERERGGQETNMVVLCAVDELALTYQRGQMTL